jgi:hypothetical protein
MIDGSATDARRLVVCSLRYPSRKAGVVEAALYGSSDGGETWKPLHVDSGDAVVSEVACAVGKSDTVYFVSSHNGQPMRAACI